MNVWELVQATAPPFFSSSEFKSCGEILRPKVGMEFGTLLRNKSAQIVSLRLKVIDRLFAAASDVRITESKGITKTVEIHLAERMRPPRLHDPAVRFQRFVLQRMGDSQPLAQFQI